VRNSLVSNREVGARYTVRDNPATLFCLPYWLVERYHPDLVECICTAGASDLITGTVRI